MYTKMEEKKRRWTAEKIAQKGVEYTCFIVAIFYLNSRVNELQTKLDACQQDKVNILMQSADAGRTSEGEVGTTIIADVQRKRTAWRKGKRTEGST